MKNFQIAVGSVTGTSHRNPLRLLNNQDAFSFIEKDNLIIAVIADGCGAGKHSEVGSKLGVKLITSELAHGPCKYCGEMLSDWDASWERINSKLQKLVFDMSHGLANFEDTVRDYFLFTIIGVAITPEDVLIFHKGDGLYSINGNINSLYQENCPDYFGHGLLRPFSPGVSITLPQTYQIDVPSVKSIVLATDGAEGYDINQFTQEKYFENSDNIRRKLALDTKLDQSAYNRDDVTILSIRKIEDESDPNEW